MMNGIADLDIFLMALWFRVPDWVHDGLHEAKKTHSKKFQQLLSKLTQI